MSEHDLETLLELHAECLAAEHSAASHQTTSDRATRIEKLKAQLASGEFDQWVASARGEFEDWRDRCLRKLGY